MYSGYYNNKIDNLEIGNLRVNNIEIMNLHEIASRILTATPIPYNNIVDYSSNKPINMIIQELYDKINELTEQHEYLKGFLTYKNIMLNNEEFKEFIESQKLADHISEFKGV